MRRIHTSLLLLAELAMVVFLLPGIAIFVLAGLLVVAKQGAQPAVTDAELANMLVGHG